MIVDQDVGGCERAGVTGRSKVIGNADRLTGSPRQVRDRSHCAVDDPRPGGDGHRLHIDILAKSVDRVGSGVVEAAISKLAAHTGRTCPSADGQSHLIAEAEGTVPLGISSGLVVDHRAENLGLVRDAVHSGL